MKKIYISGCGGMLGAAFHKLFSQSYLVRCTDIDMNEPWLSYCDVRDYKGYKEDVLSFRPDYLFHLAALTDLEYCELHSDEAFMTNTIGSENAVYISNELDIPLLYISTAGIFRGDQDYYDDWGEPSPMGHYAKSKYYAEIFVRENVRKHFICRAGWMMGGGPKKDKKFVNKIVRQIKAGRVELDIVNDKFGTPTYTHDFAASTKELIENDYYGLYNMACQGLTSRFEVAGHIIKYLGLEDKIRINTVNSDFFKKEYFAPRPFSECLINKRLELRGINLMGDWRKRLQEYLENEFRAYLGL